METENSKAWMDKECVRAYLTSEEGNQVLQFENTADNIANFLMQNQLDGTEVIITDMLDRLVLTARYSIIDICPDQRFLREELLPKLIPLQLGEREPQDVETISIGIPEEFYNAEEQETISMEMIF